MIVSAGTTAEHVKELFDTAKEKPFTLAQAIAGSLFDHGVVRAPEESMRLVEAVTMEDVHAAAVAVARSNPTVSLVGVAARFV